MYKIIVKLDTRDEIVAPICYSKWGAVLIANMVAGKTDEAVHIVDTGTNKVIWKND